MFAVVVGLPASLVVQAAMDFDFFGDLNEDDGGDQATTRMRVKGDALARPVRATTRMRVPPGALARRELAFKTDLEDQAHERSCTNKKTCPWCKYLTFRKKWGSHFRMLDADDKQRARSLDKKQRAVAGMSWLGKAHASDGEVMLGCLACHALGAKALGNPLGCYLVPANRLIQSAGKPHVLQRHASSKLHTHAVAKFLGLQGGALMSSPKCFLFFWPLPHVSSCARRLLSPLFFICVLPRATMTSHVLSGPLGAPPIEEFQTVWTQIAAGQRCRRGIAAIGSEKRVVKLSGCLYEALRETDARFLLQSQVIWLARDARQGRLLIRFKAAHFVKGEIVIRQGVLGQAKNGGTSAQDILEATKGIIIRACTPTTLATTTPRGAPSNL
jgi:hypothetical protein